MNEGDRDVIHSTDVKAIQHEINSAPKEKAQHSAAEDKVLMDQAAIKNGAVVEVNSTMTNLAAFNVKAPITLALQQVNNAKQALHTADSSTQGLARCLHKAKQSLKEAWADTQMVSFTNIDVEHASIAMADVGARAVHAGLHTLRARALRVGTGAHSCSLGVLTKDIPITSSNLFGGDLGKTVVKAATASRNYKTLGDCFVLLDLSWPKPPSSRKQKASASPAFHGDSWSRHGQGQSSPNHSRFRKRMCCSRGRGKGADQQSGKPKQPQWQHPKQGNKPKSKPHKEKKGSNI